MTGILNDQSDIVLTGKLNSGNQIIGPGNNNRVAGVVTQFAWLGCWGVRVACLVLKVGAHDLSWMVDATIDIMLSIYARKAWTGIHR